MRSSSTPSPAAVSSGHGDIAAVPELRQREEVTADFCLRALRTSEVASLLDDAVGTAARVLGCELVRVVELRGDGEEVVVAVSGVGERAEVFVEGAGTGVEVPIPGRTRPFGVLGAYSKTARFPPADVGFLQVLAITTGHAVERLRRERRATADEASATGTDRVIHDLRNLLTVIAGNVELLLDQYDAGSQRPTELEAIDHAARRAEVLLQRLLTSAAPSERTGGSAPTGTGQAVDS